MGQKSKPKPEIKGEADIERHQDDLAEAISDLCKAEISLQFSKDGDGQFGYGNFAVDTYTNAQAKLTNAIHLVFIDAKITALEDVKEILEHHINHDHDIDEVIDKHK